MLKWGIVFAIVPLIVGILGLTGIATGAAEIAKGLFVIFLIIFSVFLALVLTGANDLKKCRR